MRTVTEAIRELVHSAPGEVIRITLAPLLLEYINNQMPPAGEWGVTWNAKVRARIKEGILAEGDVLMGIPVQIDRRLDPCQIEMTCRVVVSP